MNSLPATLVAALDNNQDNEKSITYISGQDKERCVSYPELKDRALGLLHHYQAKGIKEGDEVIVHLAENEQFIDAFWACQYGGIVAVPLAIGTSDSHKQKVFNVFEKLDSAFIATSRKALQRLAVYADENGLDGAYQKLQDKAIILERIESLDKKGLRAEIKPEQTAFIQFSSGSTGDPKGVVLSHKNLMTNLNGIITCGEFVATDSFFSWMPLTHDLGIIGFHMTPLVLNVDQFMMPTEIFIRRPNLWLEKSSEKKATILASPNFGYKHVLKRFKADQQTGLDLSNVRLLFNGAEPISADLCREFNQVMLPFGLQDTAMFTVYGLAEACLVVTFPKVSVELSTLHIDRNSLISGEKVKISQNKNQSTTELVRLGTPISGTDMMIADEDKQPVADNTIGRVLIKGDNVTKGYYGADELNKALFSEGGWLDTGDQGLINEGQLVITGRTKDLIIVNGQNYYAPDLEAICEHVDGIELGKVVVCGVRDPQEAVDELVVFVLYRGELEGFYAMMVDVRRQLSEKAGLDVAAVLPIKSVPKTTSGKVQRFSLAAAYASNEYAEIQAALNELLETQDKDSSAAGSTVERQLLEVCNTVIADVRVTLHDNIFDMGASSLTLAQIHEKIDEIYPDVIELADFFDYPTIEALAQFIENKLGE